MNLAQFKDPVSHMCRTGTVVASWSFTHEVAGLSPFNDKHLGKTPIYQTLKFFRIRVCFL